MLSCHVSCLFALCFVIYLAVSQDALYTVGMLPLTQGPYHLTPPLKTNLPIAESGDNLGSIATLLNVPLPALEQANPGAFDGGVAAAGQVLNLPVEPVDENLLACGDAYYQNTSVRLNRCKALKTSSC